MHTLKGIAASPGIATAKAIILDSEEYEIPQRTVDSSLIPAEMDRIGRAFDASIDELTQLEANHDELNEMEIRALFAVHRRFLQDRWLREKVTALVRDESVTAEYAVSKALTELQQHFGRIRDRYMSERAADILDLEKRLLKHLIELKKVSLEEIKEPVVIIAQDLRPTQTASFDRQFVKGIACATGGETGHASIVARAMGIPAVMAVRDLTQRVRRGDTVVVDGNRGTVVINPDEATLVHYDAAWRQFQSLQQSLESVTAGPAKTKDGVKITMLANIEFPEETQKVLDVGADGIGLFRTEFLYLQAGVEPSEEDHFKAYAQVVKALDGRPVTIRTMDLGADKFTQSHRFVPETNPFLGLRSIRFSFKHKDMFVAQLRAILRVSALGPVKIMFPLVCTLRELMEARRILASVQPTLDHDQLPYDKDLHVGVMIEVPSAAVMASSLARHADFFSIGTNDLTQYTLAVDRGSAQVADLFSASDPAVLRLVRTTIEGARTTGIDVSICGEMAAEPKYVMLLLGMGVRTLSVTPAMIPETREIIRSVDIRTCQCVAEEALEMECQLEIDAYLLRQAKRFLAKFFPV